MMTKQSDKEIFVCRGPAFEALKEYQAAFDLLVSDHNKLQKEFNDKALKQRGVHEAKMHDLWVTMALRVGLDPEKTWNNPSYRIETNYLDEGFGAIVYEKVPEHPLAALMGREKEEGVDILETPDKKAMH